MTWSRRRFLAALSSLLVAGQARADEPASSGDVGPTAAAPPPVTPPTAAALPVATGALARGAWAVGGPFGAATERVFPSPDVTSW